MDRYKVSQFFCIVLGLLLILTVPGDTSVAAQSSIPVQPASAGPQFIPPLGFWDGEAYGPHVQLDDRGNVIEDTRYGKQNPDMIGQTCFGVSWEKVYHSGEDLYRLDGSSTAGADVTAVGDGTVVYANPNLDFPGLVVIIEHTLPGRRKIYSMYAHLDPGSLDVSAGDSVVQGQSVGTVMYQRYSGRFASRHPSGDDSHLHFEMRYFLDGRDIYGAAYPDCNGLVAGRGYTYPQHPDDFPAPGMGYVDPTLFVGSNK